MVSESICCAECQKTESKTERKMLMFDSEEQLRCHIAMEHVFWIPFECILCPMMLMPTETVLKQHYERTHPGEVPKAIYTFKENKKLEMRRIFEKSKVAQFQKRTPAKIIPSSEQVIHITPSPQQRKQERKDATNGVPTAVSRWNLETSSSSIDIHNDASFDTSSTGDAVNNGRRQARRFTLNLSPSLQARSSRDTNHDHRASASGTDARETEIETTIPLPTVHQSDQEVDSKENILSSTADNRKSAPIDEEVTIQTSTGELDASRTNVSKVHRCLPCGYKISNKGVHIWAKHMSQKRYACQLCPYETSWGRVIAEHNKKEHAHVGAWTDRAGELTEQHKTAMKLCFGARRKSTGLPSATTMDEDDTVTEDDICGLCKKPTPIRKMHHIWEEHMQTKRFGCNRCEYENNFSIGIYRHAAKHRSNESTGTKQQCMTYRADVKRVADEYDRVYASAFGRQQNSAAERGLRLKRGYSSVGSAATAPKIARREAKMCRLCGRQVQNQALHIQRHHLGATSADSSGTGDSYDDMFQKAFG